MQKLASIKLAAIIFLSLLMAGCTGNSTVQEIVSPELTLSAEGPLYAGANSATATWEFDLAEILGNSQIKVSEAKITSVEVIVLPSENLPAMEKMVFEVTSKNTPMTRVGLFEGAITAGQTIALTIAAEQENLASAFADGKMTFVGDFDLIDEEYLGNVEFTLKVKFEAWIN